MPAPAQSSFADARIVRLNASLMPVTPVEARLYKQLGVTPVEVEAFTPDEIISIVEDCDALAVVSASLPKEVIDSLSNCRLISRLGNGTDKIDLDTATRKGIVVSNVPYFCVTEMADHVMAVLLLLSKQIPHMSQHMRAGNFQQAREEGIRLPRLSGQKLGLIGFGASAKAVARRAKPFGLELIATRQNQSASSEEADALGVRMVDLETLLAESDFVSLHLPLDTKTHHMLDRAALERMKPGAVLINTSRGAIVDEDALVDVLRDGPLAGAGLDTFDVIDIFGESQGPPEHPLLNLDNVILTPHVSGLSIQSLEDIAVGSVQNMLSVLSGHMPHPENVVNPDVVPRFRLDPHDAEVVQGISSS
jgi:D-3-phosphoglycerate dehydrogenase